LMSRRGCSLPANASGFDPHRASVSSRFGQVSEEAAQQEPGEEERGRQGWLQVLEALWQFTYVTLLSGVIGVAVGILAALMTRWWWIRGLEHVVGQPAPALLPFPILPSCFLGRGPS
jgi:hypothetical protein